MDCEKADKSEDITDQGVEDTKDKALNNETTTFADVSNEQPQCLDKEVSEVGSVDEKKLPNETEEGKTPDSSDNTVVDANALMKPPVKPKKKRDSHRMHTHILKGSKKNKCDANKTTNTPTTNGVHSDSAAEQTLPELLLNVISNLYLNPTERLRLDVPPSCAMNLEFCHQNHFRASQPHSPNYTQMKQLKCALEQERYLSYINFAQDMCHRNEFPGDSIFTELIELILSINSKTYNSASLHQLYIKCIALFRLFVRTFPPCWKKMRPHYVNFLQCYLDINKLSVKKDDSNKSVNPDKIFPNLLNMLDDTLKQCTSEELCKMPECMEDDFLSDSQSMANNSAFNAPLNQRDWELQQIRFQTFEALKPNIRLERIMVALNLILQILENDFVLWLLHYYKHTKDFIFSTNNCPLAVLVFELTLFTRNTDMVKRVFEIFARAASKKLCPERLQIIERYISLIMIASNTADMENTVIGVKYPYLGAETKKLIYELFKAFKKENTSDVNVFVRAIEMFRQPFVRYEFIDHFLRVFYFPSSGEMRPEKIAMDILKGQGFLKYNLRQELEKSESNDELSVEQYLQLLLIALKSYCEWHGQRTFLRLRLSNQRLPTLQTTTDSAHRWIVPGNGVLKLKLMGRDINELEKKLRKTVRVSKPRVDLPLADICIDEDLIKKYHEDLKYVKILHEYLPRYTVLYPNINFRDLQDYLDSFVP